MIPTISLPSSMPERIELYDAEQSQNRITSNYSIHKLDRDSRSQGGQLANQFNEQALAKFGHLEHIPIEWQTIFFESTFVLLKFSPEIINVEITSANSIFMPCKIGDKNVYWEVFLNKPNSPKVVLNIFENKKQFLSNSGSLWLMKNELSSIFKDQVQETPYGISRNTASTTIF